MNSETEASEIRRAKREKRAKRAEIRARRASRALPKKPETRRLLDPTIGGPTPRNSTVITIPRTFSFIEAPEEAIEVLENLDSELHDKEKLFFRIDHRRCDHMDLCASAILDERLMDARKRARRHGRPMNLSGTLSKKSLDVNIMLCAAGLPHRLGVKEVEVPPELRDTFTPFEIRGGTGSHPGSSKQRDRCGTDLTEYFDQCLQKQGFMLSEDGKYQVVCLLTEVIGNAEEHGGPWHATGFWNGQKMQTERGFAGEVHLLIYNDGKTIYEALQHKEMSPELRLRLKTLSRIHQTAFQTSNGLWNEETLWTLYALQDQVSRYTGLPEGRSRGNGTIKMIEFFDGLAAKDRKKMCILSGGAYILLDGTYRLQASTNGLQKIAFNQVNDLARRPDSKYVRALKKRFPGTIVSIRLVLDAQYLDQIFIGPQQQKV